MGETTEISWTDHTFNPWWGCIRVSPGCEHCYAETFDKRVGGAHWGPAATTERRLFGEAHWREPLKWNAKAEQASVRRRVFCASMADVFEDHPALNTERYRLWRLIEQTPHLDWLLLTKRPENIAGMVLPRWLKDVQPNVWLGTTVEDQDYAERRIPILLGVPAVVRFLSYEPALGQLDLSRFLRPHHCSQCGGAWDGHTCGPTHALLAHDPGITWVIAGGESGAYARLARPDWFRQVRDDCQASGVAFHFKQWGEWWPSGPRIVEHAQMVMYGDEPMYRVGKKRAGRELDGREWSEFPQPARAAAKGDA